MNNILVERLYCVRHSLSLAFAAFVAGSRSIPLGDNGGIWRELAHRNSRTRARVPDSGSSAAEAIVDDSRA